MMKIEDILTFAGGHQIWSDIVCPASPDYTSWTHWSGMDIQDLWGPRMVVL